MIEDLVVKKVENFRTHFPFGCPKDDLKVTFKLLNLVSDGLYTSCSKLQFPKCTTYFLHGSLYYINVKFGAFEREKWKKATRSVD